MRVWWLSVLSIAVALAACVEPIDEEQSRIGELMRDCVVPLSAGVGSWAAPIALEYPEGSLWIFESLRLDDGTEVRNAFALIPDADSACAGDFELVRQGDDPTSALLLTAAEQAENEARDDGRRLDLAPLGGLVHEDRGILYYEERLNGPGFFDSELLGRGICLFEDGPTAPCTRVVRDGTTRLWDAHDRPFNRGGFVEDGHAMVYGCQHVAAFEDHCTVARAPLEQIDDPDAYLYFSPFNGWIEDAGNAGVVLENPGQLTVSFNPFRNQYTAIAMDIFESRLVMYTSADATSFDGPVTLFDAVPPSSFFLGGGVEHTSLSEDGRTIHVSYHTNAEGAENGLHLASFRFFGDSE